MTTVFTERLVLTARPPGIQVKGLGTDVVPVPPSVWLIVPIASSVEISPFNASVFKRFVAD